MDRRAMKPVKMERNGNGRHGASSYENIQDERMGGDSLRGLQASGGQRGHGLGLGFGIVDRDDGGSSSGNGDIGSLLPLLVIGSIVVCGILRHIHAQRVAASAERPLTEEEKKARRDRATRRFDRGEQGGKATAGGGGVAAAKAGKLDDDDESSVAPGAVLRPVSAVRSGAAGSAVIRRRRIGRADGGDGTGDECTKVGASGLDANSPPTSEAIRESATQDRDNEAGRRGNGNGNVQTNPSETGGNLSQGSSHGHDRGQRPPQSLLSGEEETRVKSPPNSPTPTPRPKVDTKRKILYRPVPPPQVLCEALSSVTALPVSVDPGEGTWGGEGWVSVAARGKNRGGDRNGRREVILPLKRFRPPSNPEVQRAEDGSNDDENQNGVSADALGRESRKGGDKDEWDSLKVALRSVLDSSSDNPFKNHLFAAAGGGTLGKASQSKDALRKAVRWHSRIGAVPRDCPFVDGDDGVGREGLRGCLDAFGQYLARECALRMKEEVRLSGMAADDDDEEEGLFGDDYGGSMVEDSNGGRPQSEVEEWGAGGAMLCGLMELLEAGGTFVGRGFLSDLVLAYDASDDRGNSEGERLAPMLLSCALARLPQTPSSAMPSDTIRSRLSAVSNLLVASPDVAAALSRALREEAGTFSPSVSAASSSSSSGGGARGRELELASVVRPLISSCAYTVPDAGMEIASSPNRSGLGQRLPRFYGALSSVPNFPLCLYSRQRHPERALWKVVEEARLVMRASRAASATFLKRAMAASAKQDVVDGRNRGGVAVFDWLGCVVRSNEALVNILHSDLLATTGLVAECSTRPFLLGITSAVLHLCHQSLEDRFEEKGPTAFDVRYLLPEPDGRGEMLGIGVEEKCLCPTVQRSVVVSKSYAKGAKYSGATEFFFVLSSLLRVSVFPALRVDEEFHQKHEHIFAFLRSAASDASSTADEGVVREQHRRSTSALLGWMSFFEDEDFVREMTSFSLLQLRWLASLAKGGKKSADMMPSVEHEMGIVPEWMCKLPAQWIARVALFSPHLLKPRQGEDAVKCATELLGLVSGGGIGPKDIQFSPAVLTELIRIAGAFVRAGVARARRRHLARRRRVAFDRTTIEEEDAVDDRELDIYLSFDASDLGVTVFTNRYVSTQLCPALVRTYSALDAVEGMDVEREHHFDKFQVKGEVAELLLRLWCHPSGECRSSIVQMEDAMLSEFVSSLAASIMLLLDDSLHKLSDIRDVLKQHGFVATTSVTVSSVLSTSDVRYIEFHAKHLASSLASSRRLLLLLCRLSEEERIASMMGGVASISSYSTAMDLANMVVHFLDLLTAEDGGTKPNIDFRRSQVPTCNLATQLVSATHVDRQEVVCDLLEARRLFAVEFGLDVSVLSHQFLALAARWHIAAVDAGKNQGANTTSPFLNAVSSNEDVTVAHFRHIFRRLIVAHEEMTHVSEGVQMFERDGHIETAAQKPGEMMRIFSLDKSSRRARMHASSQDQMTHRSLNHVASNGTIATFLDDLEVALDAKSRFTAGKALGEEEMTKLEQIVLQDVTCLREEEYEEDLSTWIVSSESFQLQDRTYAHCYDATARARGLPNAACGKTLTKEARKCQRNLPPPHPNASIFVCFSEERMDLCRAVVIGAVDTPYSLGVFEFDVFFPCDYPTVSPLLTFMTTGGGQVRFNPNLYNDGKVCISLLGTARAWDNSQRWDPAKSSLAQVLLSIQTQILGVPEPFFNEGFGHEGTRDTPSGREGSKRYNASLRLATLRHAIVAQLRKPPRGFEEVTRRHFAMCRKRVLVQARRWTEEARGTDLYVRFCRAYKELVFMLSADELRFQEKLPSGGDESPASKGTRSREVAATGVLPPLKDDVNALKTIDPVFVNQIFRGSTGQGVGPFPDGHKGEPPNGSFDQVHNLSDLHMNDTESSGPASILSDPGAATGSDNPWANYQSPNVQGGGELGDASGDRRNSVDDGDDSDDDFYS